MDKVQHGFERQGQRLAALSALPCYNPTPICYHVFKLYEPLV